MKDVTNTHNKLVAIITALMFKVINNCWFIHNIYNKIKESTKKKKKSNQI